MRQSPCRGILFVGGMATLSLFLHIEFLKTRNFEGNDLACYDGVNWIKLSEVPGIQRTPDPVLEQTNQNTKTSKSSPTAKVNAGADLHEVKPTQKSKKKISQRGACARTTPEIHKRVRMSHAKEGLAREKRYNFLKLLWNLGFIHGM